MNKLGRVLACTTLAATLTMTSLTGCGNTLDGTKTVATVGKEEITAGTSEYDASYDPGSDDVLLFHVWNIHYRNVGK